MKLSAKGYLLGSLVLLAACSSGLEQGPELGTQAAAKTIEIPLSNNADDAEQNGSRLVNNGQGARLFAKPADRRTTF